MSDPNVPTASPRDFIARARVAFREMGARLSDVPAIQVPATGEIIGDAELGGAGGPDMVAADLIADVRAALPEGISVNVVPASVGRGAEGWGAVLELAALLSAPGGIIQTALYMRDAYRAVSRRLGYAPCVSLGAARLLAVAHLVDRLERPDHNDIELIGANDLSDTPPDFSYTGLDNFWIALRHGNRLYCYIVSARGRPLPVGDLSFRESQSEGPPGSRVVGDE